jgi:hypothetical protein
MPGPRSGYNGSPETSFFAGPVGQSMLASVKHLSRFREDWEELEFLVCIRSARLELSDFVNASFHDFRGKAALEVSLKPGTSLTDVSTRYAFIYPDSVSN